ncbi:T9SS C-terminal target domain-containing protein [Lutibacter sp. HS1-25]|uniref:alpha-amylase family glycosyl hydrolase n=1 Tax=Lutibacter sp. HS1-25 TaxID=2485000 RepID=UPI001013A971|nr:alpha-amylase family glycosyl hydrolase [Lutibacter sp. HS1-25]RXP63300.1 T9SS C-terminal target domain-containing protein [Lutibacter sp. HS1-25]
MKKTVLLLFLIFSNIAFSQVSTVPTIPTASTEIIVTLNTSGTELENYTGDIYAHTGVLTNKSTSTSDWKYVIANWDTNIDKAKLTKIAANTYQFKITPNIKTFYNIPSSETVTDIAIVFRSADRSKQTRPDIFIKIFADGLNVTFTNPTNNNIYQLNELITIAAESSINADLELFVNGISEQTATASTTISKPYTFTSSGLQTLKVTAVTSTENMETEISVYVKTPTQEVTKPTGLKYGLNKNPDNSVTFLLKAPLKNDVFLIGDFNNWKLNPNYQLKKDGDDFWLTIPNLDINTEYAYQYMIDYNIKVADPYSEKILDPDTDQYIKDGNYPNLKNYPTNLTTGYVSTFLINEENYAWNITDFTKPNQNNLIVYELLIRDFTESDSYNEAATHLDYLASLGVNAIELMPINEFEGTDSWGYNPALYMALDKAYGTKNAFKKFVDECHKRGIAVIVDVVFNHSFDQSPMAQMYWNSEKSKPAADNPWYNEDHNLVDNTSAHWGNDFNHGSIHTVSFFKDVLSYWINEYKIDGYRFDFTKGFSNTLYYGENNWASAYDAARIAILKNYADHVWSHNPANKPYVIFEHLSENTEEKELANYGIMLWGNLNHSYNQNTMGYSSESDISWMSYKNRGWNNPNIMGYMESHDEERLMYKNLQYGNSNSNYNVKDLNTALSRQEIAAMFFFTIPGPKMIWQFGELGYDFSIDENGRVGRKPIKWDYTDNINRKHIYNTWATLIAFKTKYPNVFNTTNFEINVGNTYSKSITLKNASMDVVIVGNFDIVEKNISTTFTKTGTWYEYFTGEQKNVNSTSQTITLKPGEYKMYSTTRLLDPRGGTATDDSDNDGVPDTEDLCPNTMEGIKVNSTGCPIFTLPSTNFKIEATGETCINKANGKLLIIAEKTLNYSATIKGKVYQFTKKLAVENLAPGNFDFCITVDGETFSQCYNVTIEAGFKIEGKASVNSNKMNIDITQGTPPFDVLVNGIEILQTNNTSFSIDANSGDLIEVKTNVKCEGVFSKKMDAFENISAYPNPTTGIITLELPIAKKEVYIELYNMQSQLISSKTYPVIYGKVQLNIENKPKGLYLARVITDTIYTIKILKQ